MQVRKVKIMKIKASWGPLKVGGPREVYIPCPPPPPPPPPLGGPVHGYLTHSRMWVEKLGGLKGNCLLNVEI